MNFISLVIILLIAADLIWWRAADVRLRHLAWGGLWRVLVALFMASMVVYMLGFLAAPEWIREDGNPTPIAIHATVYVWHMLVMPLSCVILLLGGSAKAAVIGLARRSRLAVRHRPPTPRAVIASASVSADPRLSRRQLLGAAAAAIPPITTAGLVGRGVYQLDKFRINHVTVPIPALPADLDGLTIAHVSDVHIGKLTRPWLLPRLTEATNQLNADLIALTGDLIDLSIDELPTGIRFVQSLVPRRREFLAMIEGNHDLLDDGMRFYQDMTSAGIPLLLNRAKTLHLPGRPTPVQLLGMRWSPETRPGELPHGAGGRRGGEANIAPSMARLLPQIEPGAFPILLAHHPHAFDAAAAAGIQLTLAGHTHGGQVMLGKHFGPGAWFYRYYSGLYRKGNAHAFVSNGVGDWFPLRINAPAEIVHLTLRRA